MTASSKVSPNKPRNIYTITRGKHKGTKFPEQGSWHLDRKKKIVAKHPEIEDLYGTEIKTFYFLVPLWAFHVGMAIFLRDVSWPTWLLFVYTIGAWNAFQIQALGHEAVHGLVWKNTILNKITASFAFLPVFCSPFGSIWGVEHLWHHNVVVDKVLRFGKMSDSFGFKVLASAFTITIANVFLWVASKLAFIKIFVTFAKFAAGKSKTFFPTSFDAILFRDAPGILSWWFIINEIVSNLFNFALIHYFGWSAFFYLFMANGFGNGLHPLGFRNVQEHMVRVKNQPTYSVYHSHPLDWLIGFNINYHVEHHDFSRIPWSRLPEVRKIAPEFYNNLYSYSSYTQVMKDFFTEPGIPAETFFEGALELFGKPKSK